MGQRQHTVPKGYLIGFANGKKQLKAFDRDKRTFRTISIGDASVVPDIYRVPENSDGVPPDAIESLLAKKDSAVAPILFVPAMPR